MTVQQAESILVDIDVKVAFQHRFAGDRGTILRLDNYAMINIYDDGRYYIQGDDSEELLAAFSRIEQPWNPETWDPKGPDAVLPWLPPKDPPNNRLEPPKDPFKRFQP
jgi:hypothetical protein